MGWTISTGYMMYEYFRKGKPTGCAAVNEFITSINEGVGHLMAVS
jgi:hypothetical protein